VHWTKEIADTSLLLADKDGSQIWAQYLLPSPLIRFFGIRPRLLVACYVSSSSASGLANDPAYVSARSLPNNLIKTTTRSVPVIDWRGAFRLTPTGANSCSVSKLDREDQKGLFPAFLMNRTMPKFLAEEVSKVSVYVTTNADILMERYNEENMK
jgi:hypothetical protein